MYIFAVSVSFKSHQCDRMSPANSDICWKANWCRAECCFSPLINIFGEEYKEEPIIGGMEGRSADLRLIELNVVEGHSLPFPAIYTPPWGQDFLPNVLSGLNNRWETQEEHANPTQKGYYLLVWLCWHHLELIAPWLTGFLTVMWSARRRRGEGNLLWKLHVSLNVYEGLECSRLRNTEVPLTSLQVVRARQKLDERSGNATTSSSYSDLKDQNYS